MYSECVEFAYGIAGTSWDKRCDLFKAGCPSYTKTATWFSDWYLQSTSVFKKYKILEGYNFDWFEYKANMDIVQGKQYDTNDFMIVTPNLVCPAVRCYLNTGTDDPTPTDVSTTTCTPSNANVDNKLSFV